jgi:RNA polymerase sigma-70 factor (ECF subfamily)
MEGIAHVDASAPGRDDVFAAAVGPHYPGLVRRLTAVVGDRESALDLAQETYLRAFRAWDRFDGTDSRAWLHTIGLRLAFNERRETSSSRLAMGGTAT